MPVFVPHFSMSRQDARMNPKKSGGEQKCAPSAMISPAVLFTRLQPEQNIAMQAIQVFVVSTQHSFNASYMIIKHIKFLINLCLRAHPHHPYQSPARAPASGPWGRLPPWPETRTRWPQSLKNMTWTWSFFFVYSESRPVSSVLFPPPPSSRSKVQMCLLLPATKIFAENTQNKYFVPISCSHHARTPVTQCPRPTGWRAQSPPCPRWTSRPRCWRTACHIAGSVGCPVSSYAPDLCLWVHIEWHVAKHPEPFCCKRKH